MTVTGPKTVIFTRDTTIERTTDFTAGVDINRAALNTQLDTLTAIAADNQDLGERSIRITDYDPAAANLLLPDAATRADKLLSFDTEGDIQVQSASDLLTGSILGANYTKASYTGNGTQTAYSTVESAGSKNNIQVYIDGVYQNKDTFSISGSTLTFTEAPPLNSAIEFIVGNAVTSLTTDPAVVTYNQGGTGAQDRTLTSKLQDTVSVKDFGAAGDGVADDSGPISNAFAAALAAGKVLYFPNGTYNYNTTLNVTQDINSSDANTFVGIEGESVSKVILNCTDASGNAVDLARSKNIYVKNISSEQALKMVQFGGDFKGFAVQRNVVIENVYRTNTTGEPINWGVLYNVARPASYTDSASGGGGNYGRYPLHVINAGGYNALMINNMSADTSGNIVDGSADNSAIGILDQVNNVAAPAILVQMEGNRSPEAFQNANATYKSATRLNTVWEVGNTGHLAIGASVVNADADAPGVHTIKLRDDAPDIAFYNGADSNKKSILSGGSTFSFISYDDKVTLGDSSDSNNSIQLTTNGAPATDTIINAVEFRNALNASSNDTTAKVAAVRGSNNNLSRLHFYTQNGSGGIAEVGYWASAGHLVPSGDGTQNLGGGAAANRWATVYATTGTINTSDENEKEQIADLDAAELAVATAIKGLIKKFKFRDAVAAKGDNARIHVGVIAQDIQSAFEAEGLDAHSYGIFCEDTWYEKDGEAVFPDENGDYLEDEISGATQKTRLGVRYEELFAFVIAAM
jgi:hypothetical protein